MKFYNLSDTYFFIGSKEQIHKTHDHFMKEKGATCEFDESFLMDLEPGEISCWAPMSRQEKPIKFQLCPKLSLSIQPIALEGMLVQFQNRKPEDLKFGDLYAFIPNVRHKYFLPLEFIEKLMAHDWEQYKAQYNQAVWSRRGYLFSVNAWTKFGKLFR